MACYYFYLTFLDDQTKGNKNRTNVGQGTNQQFYEGGPESYELSQRVGDNGLPCGGGHLLSIRWEGMAGIKR